MPRRRPRPAMDAAPTPTSPARTSPAPYRRTAHRAGETPHTPARPAPCRTASAGNRKRSTQGLPSAAVRLPVESAFRRPMPYCLRRLDNRIPASVPECSNPSKITRLPSPLVILALNGEWELSATGEIGFGWRFGRDRQNHSRGVRFADFPIHSQVQWVPSSALALHRSHLFTGHSSPSGMPVVPSRAKCCTPLAPPERLRAIGASNARRTRFQYLTAACEGQRT